MFYTVGEMAKILNTTPSTLRYYDKKACFRLWSAAKAASVMFKDSDYEWLLVIDCLKNTGMGIKDIKRFIEMVIAGDSTIKERLQMIIRQRESVKEQMEKLQQTMDVLDYKVWYYSTADKGHNFGAAQYAGRRSAGKSARCPPPLKNNPCQG